MTIAQASTRQSIRRRKRIQSLDITVLAGGPGAEREVSLNSGQAVRDALDRLGHRVEMLDINPADMCALERPTDFVFIALHGEFGEDGTLQTELDRRGIPYSGSGATASKQAMDKVLAKRCFERAGVPTPRYEVIEAQSLSPPCQGGGRGWSLPAERFPLPAVVKPVASGSSVDTYIARTPDTLAQSATTVVERYGRALIEQYISGRELTVAILGDEALPVCEIRTQREFYDYQAKYIDDNTQYLFDLDLPRDVLDRVQQLSLTAHRALGCRVFSRVDCILDKDSMEPSFLEVNTIPGFTSHSLVPKAAAQRGITFDQLCQRIIELSFQDADRAT